METEKRTIEEPLSQNIERSDITPMEVCLTPSEIKAIAIATKKHWLGMIDDNGQAKNPTYQAFADCMYNTMRKFEDMLPTPVTD